MLCVTLHAAAKYNCGFTGSKCKTHMKQKIHTMEVEQASLDHVTAKEC
jgi:hypothetical protein